MRNLVLLTAGTTVALAVLVSAAFGAPTTAAKVIPFTAKYSGTAVTKQTDNVADITANGVGTGTLIGRGKIAGAGKSDTSARPCVPFTGTGSMKGPGGVITFKVVPGSSGCGDEGGQIFSISGKAAVLKATGKLAHAKGTLKLTGTFDRSSGAFSVKFSGSLKR